MPDRPYKPQWKIVESTRLIYPQVVSHLVDYAYTPSGSFLCEGQDCGQLLESTLTDVVSGLKGLPR
ncbi:hypothetical protein Hanom_Chr14g01273171 [Helianthus anomalus]